MAGGIGERFGSYKIVHRLGGRPLISILMDRVSMEDVDTYISVRFGWQEEAISRHVDVDGYIYDEVSMEGPLSGIISALERLGGYRHVMFIPGDNLWIDSKAITHIYRVFKDRSYVAYPVVNGVVETLTLLIDTSIYMGFKTVLRSGKPVRPSDIARYSPSTAYIHFWVAGSPDMDYRRDAMNMPVGYKVSSSTYVCIPQTLYRLAFRSILEGDYDEASKHYILESRMYRLSRLKPLDIHAYKDSEYIVDNS